MVKDCRLPDGPVFSLPPGFRPLPDRRVLKERREAEKHHGQISQDGGGGLGGVERSPRAIDLLIGALKDKNSQVRSAAAKCLGPSKDPRAVGPLIAALKDDDQWVRETAARALGEIRDSRTFELVITMIKDPNPDVRGAAATYWEA